MEHVSTCAVVVLYVMAAPEMAWSVRARGRNMLSVSQFWARATWGTIFKWQTHVTKLEYTLRERTSSNTIYLLAAS